MSPERLQNDVEILKSLIYKICLGMVLTLVFIFIQSYIGRIGLWHAQVKSCERGIKDRTTHRNESLASYRANWVVAHDDKQPEATRVARLSQAVENRNAVTSYESRMPVALRVTAAGRKLPEFSCRKVAPKPHWYG